MINYIKQKLTPSAVVLHGVSLGGHVAKCLCNHADVVVLDRTFWKISFVARDMYNKLAQRFFGILGGVSCAHTATAPDFLLRGTPTVLLEDPNDDLVLGLSGLRTFLSAHFKMKISRSVVTPGNKIPNKPVAVTDSIMNRIRMSANEIAEYDAMIEKIEESTGLLNDFDTESMFYALRRIFYCYIKSSRAETREEAALELKDKVP